jgi:EAL and modified HD-GYP domain-containing signal transduction protein
MTDPTAPDGTTPQDPAAATDPDSPGAAGIMARQAILDESKRIIAYELSNRLPGSLEHSAQSDANLLFNALSLGDIQDLSQDMPLFINCTHESLRGNHLELVHPERVVIKLPPVEGHVPEEIESCARTMAELSQQGYRFAFDHTVLSRNYAAWRSYVAFVRLDRHLLKPEMLDPLVRYARQHTKSQLIACRIETEQQFQEMRQYDIRLFQGFWFAKPVQIRSQTIRPSQIAAIQLIERIRNEADTSAIEEILKTDPTLSFTLLKYLNSSGFGLNKVISSFRHAVMLLGRDKLLRWAALLLTMTRPGGPPPALGMTAIVRGRLMEMLAQETRKLTSEECDSAFVVGVFSLLDVLVGVAMEDVVPTLNLPESVVDVLLHQKGGFKPLLDLTLACETADDAAFGTLATELKLSNRQVNWSHLQALAWAQNLLG